MNQYVKLIVDKKIFEYDIEKAALNILKLMKIDVDKFIKVEDKVERMKNIISLLKQTNRLGEYETWYKKLVNEFIQQNNIKNLINIKKDAVFVYQTKAVVTELYNGIIKFNIKNEYTHYIKILNLELFYNDFKNVFYSKGVTDEVKEKSVFINKYLLELLKTTKITDEICKVKLLRKYRFDYINKNIDKENYREINSTFNFKLLNGYCVPHVKNNEINLLDIRFNYNYIMESMRLLL